MEFSMTLVIVILTAITSVAAFSNEKLMNELIFHPPSVSEKNQYYRFITCGLIHADYAHLIFNMFSLYMFGEFVELYFKIVFGKSGNLLYLLMYVTALAICLLPTYSKNRNNYNYYSLGASGAVSAVIFAALLFAPLTKIGFFFIPPFIPGFIFGPIYLLISAYLDKKGAGNINHSAHYWGAVYGLAFVIVGAYAASGYPVLTRFIDQVKGYLGMA
ncbi:MAG: rhomboid family intramembrane serine protease [Chitinophagaceae bacterium]|nr:rhomboid family intramembrane serine protease [Chitinophagaceae bacterium]